MLLMWKYVRWWYSRRQQLCVQTNKRPHPPTTLQEPILFVIRKQHRLSSTQVTPLAYYYVINGTVLQAPDLMTLLKSRLLTTINGLSKVLQVSTKKSVYICVCGCLCNFLLYVHSCV